VDGGGDRRGHRAAGGDELKDYTYFDHDADAGIRGHGVTLEQAFEAAAEAMFAIMADLQAVREDTAVRFAFEEPDLELALVTWLNRLLAEARSRGLVLSRFQLRREDARWLGEARGAPWQEDVARGVEVKGATLTMLAVRATDDGWEASCVVDV
jgi:SHS2 domain-containing protein